MKATINKINLNNYYFFGILIIAVIFRLISLNQSLWLDEATTASVSVMSFGQIFRNFLPGDFHPPFYYVLMKFWVDVFGNSETSLRVPSIIFGLGTVVMIYKIGRLKFTNRESLTASFLAATSGLLVYYSQEARMYSLVVFLVCCAFYFFLKSRWFFLSVTLALLAATDYVALSIIPVLFIISKNRRQFVMALIPLFVFFLFWAQTFLTQLGFGFKVSGTPWGNLLGPATVKNVLLIPVKFIIGRVSIDNIWSYTLTMSVVVLVFAYLTYKVRRSYKEIWLWAVLPLTIGILVSLKIPTLTYFRFIFVLPAFYLLLSAGIWSSKKFSFVFMAIVATVNLVSTITYLYNPKFQREDWRGAVTLIESQRPRNSLVVFVTRSNWEAYKYYAPDAKIVDPSMVTPGHENIYLMRYVYEIFDPKDTARLKILSEGYVFDGTISQGGIEAYRFKQR